MPLYSIPAYNFEALNEEVTRMNRRAAKLGCQPLALRVVREYQEERKTRNGAKYMQSRMEVELLGETPKFNGWSLVAAVEMQENGENLLRCVPGRTVPEAYRATDTHCDHCKSTRRRKEVFILSHDDGRFVQVGRQCIADFLGHVSADNLASRAEWEFSALNACKDAMDEDFCYGGGRGEWRRDITEYLATVAIVVRRLGWVSRSMLEKQGNYDGVTTASTAWQILVNWRNKSVQEMVVKHEIHAEERDETLAKEALEWARSLPATGVGDYLYNLGVACRQSFVNLKNTGIVASAIAAYQRHLDKEAELNIQRRRSAERKHVGEVGKRIDFENVTIKRMRYFESPFGVKTLVTFEDQSGDVLVWWASRELNDVQEGDVANIRGTVKKHSDYKGMPQTELQRVKIEKIEAPALQN